MAAIALALAVAAFALGVYVLGVVQRDRRRIGALPREGNLLASLNELDEDIGNLEAAVAKLVPAVQSLAERMPGALRYAAVVTFDANEERTGHMSRAIAILNERRDGLVITLLHGPRQTLFFTKMVQDGKGTEPLSPEEQAAVDRALGE